MASADANSVVLCFHQDALAAPLHRELMCVAERVAAPFAAAGEEKDAARSPRLATLLRIYTAALSAHAACTGLHPQVKPLPGQDAAASSPDPDPRAGSVCVGAGGYFAALGSAPGGQSLEALGVTLRPAGLPSLAEVLADARRASPAGARAGGARNASRVALAPGPAPKPHFLPAVACALQRMAVLHERVLRLRCTCPTGAAEAGATEGATARFSTLSNA